MAIQVNVKSANGVVLNYHHIAAVNIETNQRLTLLVRSYIDQQGRQYDKDYALGKISGDPVFPYTDSRYINIDWISAEPILAKDVIPSAYAWLKSLPEFAGAVDV